MNYNAHGLSAVPVSIFWTPLRVGNVAAAAGKVIVIISSLWSLKLRAQKRWVLAASCPPQVYPIPDLFRLMYSRVWLVGSRLPPCSLEAHSETHWLLGARTRVCGWGSCLWYSLIMFEKSPCALGVRKLSAHLSSLSSKVHRAEPVAVSSQAT